MKSFLLTAILALVSATHEALDGRWESPYCINYPKGPSFEADFFATDSYQFENGQVKTFLQMYDDQKCSKEKAGALIPQSAGKYDIISKQGVGSQDIYEVVATYNAARPVRLKVAVGPNMISVCSSGSNICWPYYKR